MTLDDLHQVLLHPAAQLASRPSRAGDDEQDVVAVHQFTVGVGHHHAVAVTIKSNAGVRAPAPDRSTRAVMMSSSTRTFLFSNEDGGAGPRSSGTRRRGFELTVKSSPRTNGRDVHYS